MSFKFFSIQVITVLLLLFSFSAGGKMFRAPYVEFNVGYDWTCKSFGTDWVCHHRLHSGAKPALMLITAKEGPSSDSIHHYTQSFNQEQTAQKIHIKKIIVNRHTWVESFYKNIILQNMFGRYIATVCCPNMTANIHVFIGFHAHMENYIKYSSEFLKSIKSLRLSKNLKEVLAQISGQTTQQKQDMLSYMERILLEPNLEENALRRDNKKNPLLLWALWAVLFLVPVLGFFFFFYYRKRRRNDKLKSTQSKRRKTKS